MVALRFLNSNETQDTVSHRDAHGITTPSQRDPCGEIPSLPRRDHYVEKEGTFKHLNRDIINRTQVLNYAMLKFISSLL